MKNSTTTTKSKTALRIILFAVLVIGALAAFYLFNPGKAVTLVFPDLNRISYINAVIKHDSAYTKISMVLQNKNPYKLDIDTVNFEVKLNDTTIAQQEVALNIKQSRFDVDTVQLPLNLHIKQIQSLIKHLQSQDSTSAQIKGYIVYQTIFGRKKINFNKEKKISVPVPPKIKILKMERKGFNFKEKILDANATIEIINASKKLDLELTDIHYEMDVKNTLHSDGLISKSITIKPQSSVILHIPIKIEVFHPLKTAWLISVDKDRLNYSLHITGNVKENVSEKSFTSKAEVFATGEFELVK